jgi:superfamily II RNA helicase
MVQLRDKPYSESSEYNPHFEKYPYPLSSFQKHAIEGIIQDNHVLVTAHTGSGKTLPAEFAIEHWVAKNKKVIYTSPIKALSNQKFYEFTNKFPHISFGLFTGDIKTNPEADVLIMTTEILMNRLFNHSSEETLNDNILQFQMDFENELAAVIFDEVHYINDLDRGQVWEKTILMLPDHVQMIMLSATMDKPVPFGEWIEKNHINKQVFVCPTNHRVVPLSHYGFMAMGEHEFKQIKDKGLQQKMRKYTNKPLRLKDSNGKFYPETHKELLNIDDFIHKQRARINRKFVLNNLVKYLKENEMLPAICFVFSRKNVETCAKELNVALLEEDSKIPYNVDRESKQILRRLPNYEEYMRLPEYTNLIALLEKGIGIHHSGMIPILREIVELFISKKYIKVLFATESFAIGLDCPIKTTVFTGITKFDGDCHRFLHSHEYTQMAGRAGRRGIDTVGYVIHCNNLFRHQPSQNEYKLMMGGKPPSLFSKFKLDYSLVLSVLKSNNETTIQEISSFIEKSMFYDELQKEKENVEKEFKIEKEKFEKKKENSEFLKTPKDICMNYLEKQSSLGKIQQKKQKKIQKDLGEMIEENPDLLENVKFWKEYEKNEKDLEEMKNRLWILNNYINDQITRLCTLLEEEGFVTIEGDKISSTTNGIISSHVAEVHGPIWVKCMVEKWNYFENFSTKQLVGLFSCASDVKVSEEYKTNVVKTDDVFLKDRIMEMKQMYDFYETEEGKRDIRSGLRYEEAFSFTVVEETMKWCDCKSEEQCKEFISSELIPKGISLGDFTKSILKIATISKELRALYELEYCNTQTEWLHKLTCIEELVLKYIATNQSLYV